MADTQEIGHRPATAAGTITLGGDLTVNRMGFGAMRLTGEGSGARPPTGRRRSACFAARSSWA